ncbi:MAG: hypothetical protein QXW62_05585 [Candidatus Methanomethylicaceae archaeon]|nr:hypothetical protein [Candidatus Verstraetearchaeota archaeon]
MHRPLIEIIVITTLISIGILFSHLIYIQGKNFIEINSEVNSLIIASSIVNACLKASENAFLWNIPVSIIVTFSQPIIINASGKLISIKSITIEIIHVNIIPFLGLVKWINITAYPNGTLLLIGGL